MASLTAAQIKQKINTLLADNTTGAISEADIREVLTDIVDSFGATQVENTMPEWAAGLTFQTDGTDSGEFCRYADTLGNIRLWVTKVDDNTGNSPPSDPNVTENTYWKEVSASNSAAFPEWAAGIYGEGLVIVYHMNAVYKLDNPTRPYNSVNIQTEIAAGDWIDLTGSSSPNVYNNVTFDSIEDAGVVSVPFDYLTTNIPQKTIDEQYDYQPNTTGAVDSYGAKQTLIANGNAAHIPTFTGFNKWPNSDDWDNTLDAVNKVAFMKDEGVYYYTIVNGSVASSPTQLNQVTLNAETNITNDGFTINWNDTNSDPQESSYLIEYDTVNTFDSGNYATTTAAQGATSKALAGLGASTQWFYRITAVGDGSTTSDSPVSATGNETTSATDYPLVTSMSVENANPNQVLVNFNQNVDESDATGWTFRINATGEALTYVSGNGTNQLIYSIVTAVQNGDALDMSYDSGVGNCAASDDAAPLQSFTQTSVTNNVAVPTFAPSDLGSKLFFWGEDARVLANSTNDGATVSAWTDKSLSADDLIAPLASDEPAYSAAEGLVFDGVNHELKNDLTKNEAIEIFIVCKTITWKSLGQIIKFRKTAADSAVLRVANSSTDMAIQFSNLIDISNVIFPSGNNLAESDQLYIRCNIKGDSSEINVNQLGQVTGSVTIIDFDEVYLPSQGGLRLEENVVELAITSALTTTERNNMDAYFAAIL